MDKNFRVRAVVSVVMFIVAIIALYIFDSVPFKIIYALFSLIALIEMVSFFKKKHTISNMFFALLEVLFLIGGVVFVAKTNMPTFWYIILGVPGYDIFAYLFGNAFGGKIFKTRPFPKISKGKTWEGTILGLAAAMGMVALLVAAHGTFATDWIFILCGPLALAGDLFESWLKRSFGVKDSNEIVIKNPVFKKLEMLVGGAEGHGGFLDRIDSTAFATTILLLISLI